MSRWTYILRGLWHHRRIQLTVAFAVAIATAVVTGALIVGDSVRGSLRAKSLDRLGKIDELLLTNRYFDVERVDDLSKRSDRLTAPAIILPRLTIERVAEGQLQKRQNSVTLIGCDERFWQFSLSSSLPQVETGAEEIVLNSALAEQIGAEVGDRVTIRFPDASPIAADSALGQTEGRVVSLSNLRVASILPANGLASFSLHPTQQSILNAFVSMESIQNVLDQRGRVNAIVRGGATSQTKSSAAKTTLAIDDQLKPKLPDFGISLTRHTRIFSPADRRGRLDDVAHATDTREFDASRADVVWDYWQLTSDQLMWPDPAREAAGEALGRISTSFGTDSSLDLAAQPLLTYLVNEISVGSTTSGIPYSTVTALNNHPTLGPIVDDSGRPIAPLAVGEIALNSWAAEQLNAQIGDSVMIRYFLPETTHGEAREATAEFRLTAITPITEPETPYRRRREPTFFERPTRSNDPDLTPTVEGVTDQESINDWDPPFPFDSSRIRKADDRYWEYHRTTPKAFVSLADGQRLWGSRFGSVTSFRVPAAETSNVARVEKIDEAGRLIGDAIRDELTKALRARQAELGYRFQSLRADLLRASTGTTPFQWLFVGFSFFLIGSAIMLIAILFRLGVELRAREFGGLNAFGWPPAAIRGVTLGEAAIVALVGTTMGICGAIGYAWLMIAGLRTVWVDAIAVPFVSLYLLPGSLAAGWCVGMLVAMLVVWLSLRGFLRLSPARLLAGDIDMDADIGATVPSTRSAMGRRGIASHVARRQGTWISRLLALAAMGLALFATLLSGEAQAGAFFGAGAFALASLLFGLYWKLRAMASDQPSSDPFRPVDLAWRTAARNPWRSTLTMGLMASATFLIAAIAAFQLTPTVNGTGGFSWIAETDRPLHVNFFDPATRRDLFGANAALLEGIDIIGLRVQDGDDASCRNLYQTQRPRLIGVSQQMIAYFDAHLDQFAWSASSWNSDRDDRFPNRWRGLAGESDSAAGDLRGEESPTRLTPTIPVVLDKNTAMYGLHLPAKIGHEFELDYDRPVRFRIVGLLSNTVLQGSLLVHEDDLVRVFPNTSGYRQFLIRDGRNELAGGETSRNPSSNSDGQPRAVTKLLETRFGDEGMVVESAAERLSELLAVQNTYLSTFQSLGGLGLLLGVFGLAAVQIRNVFARQAELALMSAVGFSRTALRRQLVMENAMLLLAGLGIGLIAALVAVLPQWWAGAASFPLITVMMMLGLISAVGLLAGLITARIATHSRLAASLRTD